MSHVKIQTTPNPQAKKFVCDTDITKPGVRLSYTTETEVQNIPILKQLFQCSGVKQVHVFDNNITVTKDSQAVWVKLEKDIAAVIESCLETHRVDFFDQVELEKQSCERTPEIEAIDEILSRTIRPGLQADGGDVDIVEFTQPILTLKYTGACGGCPSSTFGTLEAIRKILRDEYLANIEVVTI